jgi:hypothetical protein
MYRGAQNSQMNDCNYRYRGVASYVVSVDLDEIIVPSANIARNYDQLITAVHSRDTEHDEDSIAQYNFRGGFFPQSQVARDVDASDRNSLRPLTLGDLYIYKYFKRQKELHPHRKRLEIFFRKHFLAQFVCRVI